MNTPRFTRSPGGSALLVTLAALVIVTVVVVAFSVTVRLETASSNLSTNAQRAKFTADMAVDEVVSKLQSGIPTDRHWAAAPGKIVAWNGSGWVRTELHSGTSSAHGQVALNAKIFGSTNGARTILSPNREHPDPDPMNVDWINVLQDGTLSTDTAKYNPSKNNPIVVRYAYWTDIETGRVNLNTAGWAQTNYTVTGRKPAAGAEEDLQNLTGHPSRVDLSRLDDAGGAISREASKNTYLHTASSDFRKGRGAVGENKVTKESFEGTTVTSAELRQPGEGMTRFRSIQEWTKIDGITDEMVEANNFNLTTQSRTPEVNPWGLNRFWCQVTGEPNSRFNASFLNKLNHPGLPAFTAAVDSTHYRFGAPDSRYYVYPRMRHVNDNANKQQGNLQNPISTLINHYNGSVAFQNYMRNMLDLLSRDDWPGMPGVSFMDKYGLENCEQIAANLMYIFDSVIAGYYNNYALFGGAQSRNSIYGTGSLNYLRSESDGSSSKQWFLPFPSGPLVNEVGVEFKPTTTGFNRPKKDVVNGTCSPPAIPAADQETHTNIEIIPWVETVYPRSYGHNNYFPAAYARHTGIEVNARGTLNGQPVTYGYDGDAAPQPTWEKPSGETNSQYIWGLPDERNAGSILWSVTWPEAQWPVNLSDPAVPDTQKFRTKDLRSNLFSLIVGPFDWGSSVEIEVKLRILIWHNSLWTSYQPHIVIPSVLNTTNDPDDPANSTKLTYTVSYTPNPGMQSPNVSLELKDPRHYLNRASWTASSDPAGNTKGRENSCIEIDPTSGMPVFPDPVTGLVGDRSKLIWPNIGAASLCWAGISEALRRYSPASAGNTVGWPGIGWLSALPTSLHSIRPSSNAMDIPWRTVNLGPANRGNQLPDWLLLDLFAAAYDQTHLSQTSGKVNVNAEIYPFGFHRLAPLKALFVPAESAVFNNSSLDDLVQAVAERKSITTGPAAGLPDDIIIYPGQICQIPEMQGSGTDQFQREAMMRDLAGIVTTQSSDFRVYAVAQALAPNTLNPSEPGKVLAEQRIEAVVSRETDLGPDGVPETSDDMAGPDRIAGTADDLRFKDANGNPITANNGLLRYNNTDPDLEGHAGRPPFRYQVTRFRSINR